MKNFFETLENTDEEQQYKIIEEAMDKEKQAGFYKKMRKKIQDYVDTHPNSKFVNYLVAAPDFFHLLCALLSDSRVPVKNKAYIAGAILYFISPLDVITDAIPGIGFVDDVWIGVTVVKSLLNSVDHNVIIEHWAGDGDVIEKMEQLLELADKIVGSGKLGKAKNVFKKILRRY